MKKIAVITALLLASTTVMADGRHGHYRSSGYGDMLVPMFIGGAIGYVIKGAQQPQTVIVQQPQVVQVQQPIQVIPQTRSIYVYPSNVTPPYGLTCQLGSVVVDGQVVTNQYCY